MSILGKKRKIKDLNQESMKKRKISTEQSQLIDEIEIDWNELNEEDSSESEVNTSPELRGIDGYKALKNKVNFLLFLSSQKMFD